MYANNREIEKRAGCYSLSFKVSYKSVSFYRDEKHTFKTQTKGASENGMA